MAIEEIKAKKLGSKSLQSSLKEQKDSKTKKRRKFVGCSPLEHFELGEKVGEGTFGEVIKATHKWNGKTVALKKIFIKEEQEGFPITSLREIKLLKGLKHGNIASLVDMAVSHGNKDSAEREIENIYMVFPFMDHDLAGLLDNRQIEFTLPQIKCYMEQIFQGLAYLHSKQVMHRDMKASNILINNRGEVKITDFGLARPVEEKKLNYTPGVVTRWYRPPEILLGSTEYDYSIDIWGSACILAEMFRRKPLFSGESDIDQLLLISKYCGMICEESIPNVNSFPDYKKFTWPFERRKLKEFLKAYAIDPLAIDLIDKLLVLDPKKRPSAIEALKHPFFTSEPLPALPSQIPSFESSHEFTIQKSLKRDREQVQGITKRTSFHQVREAERDDNQRQRQGEKSSHYDQRDKGEKIDRRERGDREDDEIFRQHKKRNNFDLVKTYERHENYFKAEKRRGDDDLKSDRPSNYSRDRPAPLRDYQGAYGHYSRSPSPRKNYDNEHDKRRNLNFSPGKPRGARQQVSYDDL